MKGGAMIELAGCCDGGDCCDGDDCC